MNEMRSHLIKGLLLLSCIFVLSESRAVTQKEKHYLLERISEWDKAPEAVKIVEGRVTTRHGTKKYRFVYKAEDCSSCEAVLNVKKSGKGHYTWECKRRDVCRMRRRHLRKNKKPTEMKGSGEL